MTRHVWTPRATNITQGVAYFVVNNVPEISDMLFFNDLLKICDGAFRNDPFCMVYMQSDSHHWYKGEYCYSNKRFYFTAVGLAAVPDVILMMDMVKP